MCVTARPADALGLAFADEVSKRSRLHRLGMTRDPDEPFGFRMIPSCADRSRPAGGQRTSSGSLETFATIETLETLATLRRASSDRMDRRGRRMSGTYGGDLPSLLVRISADRSLPHRGGAPDPLARRSPLFEQALRRTDDAARGGRQKEKCQSACKPGSVWRGFPHVAAIRLGRPLPDASRNQPGRPVRKRPGLSRARAAPIRSCSRWGLPCRPRCRVRGGLLPHLFTLTLLEPPEGGLRLATGHRMSPMSASKPDIGNPMSAGERYLLCGTFPEVALAGR